jgi:hypothetical protein
MKKYLNHDYIVSQLLNYGVDKILTLEQNVANLMTQHRPKGICSVDNTRSYLGMSLELPNVITT